MQSEAERQAWEKIRVAERRVNITQQLMDREARDAKHRRRTRLLWTTAVLAITVGLVVMKLAWIAIPVFIIGGIAIFSSVLFTHAVTVDKDHTTALLEAEADLDAARDHLAHIIFKES